ncbi:MAG: dTDP-4-dehydrorhamnose 3,5-epimerase [Elusimicrobia bacterium CG1_02_63_36]|nr:MAG: dTDP-4-dehydrorhamnose 3,5-epimerase [Elusimicrobia bacterium CG1_02_63_36]PIP83522.1 MAG: dTDP-4-dehydrorhamnose 3,5-epimerase [Elusimicrobia bacterium CG22_combo_CG10-13_8_21_14_all_63_91]PJA14528.1 MAG: dTDP-4-dehydrorhamnose 3,5-epimerase [Elusimicrobia bacterium CG_4_10_14_0_2_um_filter_63_34]PJB26027.1 MAG: dTDP-4-dehydrorhamnose 3,5-epimerase [Elusimicrobia bacterium CG_4_9_14_3_um_filter_62_55]
MKFLPTEIPEVIVVEPDVFGDARGFFLESYHEKKYREGGIAGPFVQDNHSRSGKGILRGLHAQLKRPQGKLVRVLRGAVFDVAVDIRKGSASFGRWVGVELTGENHKQLWVPPGFAHGFSTLSDEVDFAYKCTDFYDASDEIGIVWNDPDIGVDWRLREPVLSKKDAALPTLKEVAKRL